MYKKRILIPVENITETPSVFAVGVRLIFTVQSDFINWSPEEGIFEMQDDFADELKKIDPLEFLNFNFELAKIIREAVLEFDWEAYEPEVTEEEE